MMGCGCNDNLINQVDPCDIPSTLDVLLQMICCDCKWTVPDGTPDSDFLSLAPDGVGECDLYIVETVDGDGIPTGLFLGNGLQWGQIGGSGASCVATVPAGTLPANFIATGFGGAAPSACDVLFVQYDDDTRMYLSLDNGTTWFRSDGEYVETIYTTQSASTGSTSWQTVGAPISVVVTKDHMHFIVAAYGTHRTSHTLIRTLVAVNGTTRHLVSGAGDEPLNGQRDESSASIGGRLGNLSPGDTVTITVQIRTYTNGSITGYWSGETAV